jgi:hypothetical protein
MRHGNPVNAQAYHISWPQALEFIKAAPLTAAQVKGHRRWNACHLS